MRTWLSKVVLSLAISIVLASTALAVDGDENWSPAFALPGADGRVNATIEFGGDLIVAGDFQHVGICAASRIARWDGSDWHAMGEGLDGSVLALTVYADELYAAGDFGYSGVTPIARVTRWDGVAWQPLAMQIDYISVRALADYQGQLIAAGVADFDSYEGEGYEVAGVAAWNGTSWTPLASFEWNLWCRVNALAVHEGDLILGGAFDTLNGDYELGGVARWDGASWADMGGLDQVNALIVHEAQLFSAAGYGLFRWDGISWLQQGSANNREILTLGSHAGDIIAGGAFSLAGGVPVGGLAGWDGTNWFAIGQPFDYPGDASPVPFVFTVSSHDGLLVAGGAYTQAGGIGVPRLAAWDGESWQPLINADQGEFFHGLDRGPYALAVFDGSIAIGGKFDFAYGSALNGVGLWNGTTWEDLGSGLPGQGDLIFALEEYQGELIIAGDFEEVSGIQSPNMAIWSGASWRAFGAGQVPIARTLLADGGDLFIGGSFTAVGEISAGNVACWNGVGWSNLAGGLNGAVSDLALFEGELVAAGYFTADAQGHPLARVARWDGEAWQPLGGGFNGAARGLANWNDCLIAGGAFTLADGQATAHLAAWDGLGWQPFPTGPDGAVSELASYQGDLIVGGNFGEAGGLAAACIARWNGSNWMTLGGGLSLSDFTSSMYVDGLAVTDDQLYVIGSFRNAGGKPSFGIASWTEDLTAAPEVEASDHVLGSWNVPNPFNPSTEIVFTLPAAAPVTLRIVDANGRLVRTLLAAAPRPAGEQRATWDGRDDAGRRLPSGAYLYELNAGGQRTTSKMLLLK